MRGVFSIANQKGGVGKTTTAMALATGIAHKNRDFRVLLVDLDAQRNATAVMLGTNRFNREETIYHAFDGNDIESRQLHETSLENLLMIPAALELVEIESLLTNTLDGFFRLSEALEKIKTQFDFIFLDAPPNLSVITVNALVASDWLLVPLLTSKFSVDGINGLTDAMRTVQKRYNANIQLGGGILTMYDSRTTLSQTMVPKIAEYIPLFKSRIPRSVIVEEAHLLKKDIYEYNPRHKLTLAYADLCEEVIHG